ncbi:DUF6167 family protein [Nocardioides sp. 616]|uniref:DUF6167 family protein n=1 Tax=Nocardioides sp. 616 TaxID=2268090 RepID=UPI000CE33B18|nr:DUF6167 family protein [Nocardioides sp. 616]
MSRSLWFVAGAGAGAYAVTRVRRAAESLSVDGLRDRMRGAGAGARLFREEVRAGQQDRETQLRERFGLVPDHTPQLTASAPATPPSLHLPTDHTKDTD